MASVHVAGSAAVADGSAQPRAAERHTYGQILRSTALIGGSSVVNVAFGIIRNKAMALLLGPAGMGLMGIYYSIADLTQSLAGMGIQSSGVRQIAEAVGSGEEERIARTVTVLKRISLLLGVVGGGLLVSLAGPVSQFTFGNDRHTTGITLLAFAVFLRLVAAGQGALIQGMRRISELAKVSALGAFTGTVASVVLVYFLGEQGVALSLVATAVLAAVFSWWYSRHLDVRPRAMTMSQVGYESVALLKLGLAFMASGFLTMGAAYAIRMIVLREVDFEAAGLYQSAWALGGLYVGFILQAMGADFYPRLTAVSTDDDECNRLVNEQAQISLLLAGPGVIATLTFAPIVVTLFYSAEFSSAVDLLRWVCLGMMLRVIAWPMGFIVVAKGAQAIFFWTEVAAALVHVGLAWLLVRTIGLDGAGMAFFGLYVWHAFLIHAIVRRFTGFRWSRNNVKLGLVFLPLTAAVFAGFHVLPFWLATAAGILAVLLSGLYSLRVLLTLVPRASTPFGIRIWLARLGLVGQPTASS